MAGAMAVWLVAPGSAEVRHVDVGAPGPGELLVAAELSAISSGTELLAYRGLIPRDLSPDLPTVRGSFDFPFTPGYACVGRVLEIGPGVEKFTAGQRVFALHPHQSVFTISTELVAALPGGVPPEAGVFFASLETAYTVILDAHPHLGERILVVGQGIVGLLVSALARRTGPELLAAVEPVPARRTAARALGADVALSPSEAPAPRLRQLAGGLGFDLAIEASGSAAGLQLALDAVAFQGTVVACAWYGAKPMTMELGSRFHRQRLRLVSSQVSNLDPALGPRWDRRRRTAAVLRLLPGLELASLITHRVPLAQAADAYRLLETGPDQTLQVVFTYT